MVLECAAYNDLRSSSGLCFEQEFKSCVVGHFLRALLRLDVSLLLFSSNAMLQEVIPDRCGRDQ